MKKKLLLCILLIVFSSFIGCEKASDSTESGESKREAVHSTTTVATVTEQTTTKAESKYKYDDYTKVVGRSLYINYRSGRRENQAYSSVSYQSNYTDMVVLTYNENEAFNGTLNDVFDFLNTGVFFSEIAGHSDASFYGDCALYKITKNKETILKINDMDVIQFEGTVNDTNSRSCYVYGYTFIVEGFPCMLVGLEFSEVHDAAVIDVLIEEVDTMIKTVRTKR